MPLFVDSYTQNFLGSIQIQVMMKDSVRGRGKKSVLTAKQLSVMGSGTRGHCNGNEEDKFAADDDRKERIDVSPRSSTDDEAVNVQQSRKRSYNADNGEPENFGSEMQKMLECFGADISKTLVAKRKRLEQYTQGSFKTSNKKVEELWRAQQTERTKLNDEFKRQMVNVFQQWDSDVEKSKDQEEKLLNMFKQQQKLFQQSRIVQSQRLKTVRQLHEQYTKGTDELDRCHQDQQSSMQSELKKEMSMLQKKILMDTQQQEMANVRKSLQTMLF